jgi:hypothetical protein
MPATAAIAIQSLAVDMPFLHDGMRRLCGDERAGRNSAGESRRGTIDTNGFESN